MSSSGEFEAIRQISAKRQIAEETLRRWRRKAQIDAGQRRGVSSDGYAEIRRLKKRVGDRSAGVLRSSTLAVGAGQQRKPQPDRA